MVQDFNFDVEIVGMPIVREKDGLAMSSRNTKLSPAEREQALCLSRSIAAAKKAFRGGERSVAALKKAAVAVIEAEKSPQIDYLEFRDQDSLLPLDIADDRTLLALAVRVGSVRLIDNSILGED
jgi:pantoate--beta-alanine ligase